MFGQLLQTADGRYEDVILDHRMLAQPYLVFVDVVEGGGELVVVQAVLRQVFDDEQFQLAQFLVGSPVMLREGVDIIIIGGLSVDQRLYIREQGLLLVFHVTSDLVGVFVVEAEDEFGQ